MPRSITRATSLANLKKEAKRWLKALRAGDADARARFESAHPKAPESPVLREVQHALAREHGLPSWAGLKAAVSAAADAPTSATATSWPMHSREDYERLADDLVLAFGNRDAAALQRLNGHYRRSFGFDDLWAEIWRRVYSFRQRAFKGENSGGGRDPGRDGGRRDRSRDGSGRDRGRDGGGRGGARGGGGDRVRGADRRREEQREEGATRGHYLELEEARVLIAQDAGFGSWEALIEAAASGGISGVARVPPYAIDAKESRIAPSRQLVDAEWNDLIAAMKENGITALEANGLMTDAVLARVADLEQITRLSLGGSRQLGGKGLAHLARMPQLEELDLSGYPGGELVDRDLEVLRALPDLKRFAMTWQRGLTDAGVANLEGCEKLESVDLMGSPTGDGAIAALRGKPRLRRFQSGRLVTDAGLAMLHEFPLLKSWRGGDVDRYADKQLETLAGQLLIDGPFTNAGLANLAGLEGVFWLDIFWHATGITSDGFAHLVDLPNLRALGADGAISDDTAMRHFGSLPALRFLRAQEASAGDDGFEALSRSPTLESFWGRECPNLGSRGFVALSKLPALRNLGVGLQNVNDDALAKLPSFPALRELTPIGVKDAGFRHIGRCEKLERLTCIYCRDSGDAATEHIADLRLKYYYAGLTQITDRSLQILGAMTSLEQIDMYECNGITDAGLAFLADLPRLREVNLDGMPGVTLEGTRVFPEHVRVRYAT